MTDSNRPFLSQAEMDQHIDDMVRERTDPQCDVPGCQRRWRGVRKLGWSDGVGPTFLVAYFVCPQHLKMPHEKFLKAAPTGHPGFDNAPAANDVAPWN
jgi:hypothetical protein